MSEIVKRKKTKLKISTSVCCDSGFLWAHPCGDFFIACVFACVCMLQRACGGQRTTRRSGFSPSTLWILGVEPMLSGLAASTFPCWAILPARDFSFLWWRWLSRNTGLTSVSSCCVLGLRGNTSLLLSTAFSGSTLSWGRRFNPGDGVGAVVCLGTNLEIDKATEPWARGSGHHIWADVIENGIALPRACQHPGLVISKRWREALLHSGNKWLWMCEQMSLHISRQF